MMKLIVILFLPILIYAQDTLTFFNYNLLNYQYNDTSRDQYYRTILESVSVDILVTQENTSAAGTAQFKSNVIDNVYPGAFGSATFIDGTDSDNMLYYRTSEFNFLGNAPITTALRDINEFKLVHITSQETLRIYSVHLKASSGSANANLRAAEVDSLRKVTDALLAGSNFIVCGDMNLYGSTESAYQKLLEVKPGTEGEFYDALTMTGTWNSASYASYHTQSPRTRAFGGGANGGLDDRFDLILYSKAVKDTGGIYFIPSSLTPYGNDGNHYNDSINQQPNTAVSIDVANALHYASDHLPVYAKLVFSQKAAPVGVSSLEEVGILTGYSLEQNYPNPANPSTMISFSIPNSEHVKLQIVDISGKIVSDMIDERKEQGIYFYSFDASSLSSGTYFIRLLAGQYTSIKKMILLK